MTACRSMPSSATSTTTTTWARSPPATVASSASSGERPGTSSPVTYRSSSVTWAMTGAGDSVLIGIDLVKDPEVLVRAYDDAAGVTAAFNRNGLVHVNRVLGADFDPDAFQHVALWNEHDGWIEMHLLSRCPQVVTMGGVGMTVAFERGEPLLTEISAKFTPERFADELRTAGFQIVGTWTEPPGYQLVLARPCVLPARRAADPGTSPPGGGFRAP